jgi:hypothetical protein
MPIELSDPGIKYLAEPPWRQRKPLALQSSNSVKYVVTFLKK